MSLFDWLILESWVLPPCHLFYFSILAAIVIVLVTIFSKYKQCGISDTNNEDIISKKNPPTSQKELQSFTKSSRLPYQPPELKIVTDPGKALAQMVKFKLRFHRKVKRFRERKEMENNSTKEDFLDM